MLYNISFDIAGLILIGALIFIHISTYRIRSKQNKAFRLFLFASLFSGVMDMLTAWTISYSYLVPDMLNMGLNILYQISAILMTFFGMHYIFSCIDRHSKKDLIMDIIIVIFYYSVLIINSVNGVMFRFIDHEYVKGPLFLLGYMVSFFLLCHAGVVMAVRHDRFTKRQLVYNVFFLIIPIAMGLVQMFLYPEVLLTFFAGSLSALIMMFSLETADFRRYTKTMHDLEEARDNERMANQAKSDFLARMSHEIRTPINGILGMNHMIMRETKRPEIREYSENIESAGRGLLSLIGDILDISKIEAGRMELVPAEYRLYAVLNDSYHMVAMRARDKGLNFTVHVDPVIPGNLYGDEVRVRQIIVNILNNAIKYTREGSVHLEVDGVPGTEPDKIDLVFQVSDTGIGIREEDKAKIFDGFSRVDGAQNRYVEGSGLGLAITSNLVDLMEGEIRVESVYGEGSVFTVTIPQKFTDRKAVGVFRPGVPSGVDIKRPSRYFIASKVAVLAVDDVELNLKVIEGYLRGTGIQLDKALGGMDATNKLRKKHYDVVLLDHMMPDVSGEDVLRYIHEGVEHANHGTPVIVLTANAVAGVREKYLEDGFDGYLAKPFTEEQLMEALADQIPPEKIRWQEGGERDYGGREEETPVKAVTIDPREFIKKMEGVLDVKKGLGFCSGDVMMYRDVLAAFIKDDQLEDLQRFLSAAKWADYCIKAHALKSSSRLIGAEELADLAAGQEEAARAGDASKIYLHHGQMMMTYGKLMARIREALGLF